MINNKNYFILHAPRQSVKTTFLKALTDKINKDGQRYALICFLTTLSGINDEEKALIMIVSQINVAIKTLSFLISSKRHILIILCLECQLQIAK